VRDREADQAGLGLAAAADRALVADLAAGAGGGAGEGRDRGRVVVGLDLDRVGRRFGLAHEDARGGVGAQAGGVMALDHRGVVAVGRQGAVGRDRMGVADHREQRARLVDAVQGPGGVEHLVPAVLGVGLREHHQLGVGGRPAQVGVAVAQVGDLVVAERKAQGLVGLRQGGRVDPHQRPRRAGTEQVGRGRLAPQPALGHGVVQQPGQARRLRVVRRRAVQHQAAAALDAAHRQRAAAQDLGGLGRPRRDRAQARHHVRRRHVAGDDRPSLDDRRQARDQGIGIDATLGVDVVAPVRRPDALAQAGRGQGLVQPVEPERGQRGGAVEDDHAAAGASGGA